MKSEQPVNFFLITSNKSEKKAFLAAVHDISYYTPVGHTVLSINLNDLQHGLSVYWWHSKFNIAMKRNKEGAFL